MSVIHMKMIKVKMNLARAYRQCREVRGANNGKVSSQIGREQVKQLPIQRRAEKSDSTLHKTAVSVEPYVVTTTGSYCESGTEEGGT